MIGRKKSDAGQATGNRSAFTDAIKLSRDTGGPVAKGDIILTVTDLSVQFWVGDEWFTAVDKPAGELRAGEVLAIVGESVRGRPSRP